MRDGPNARCPHKGGSKVNTDWNCKALGEKEYQNSIEDVFDFEQISGPVDPSCHRDGCL